LRRFDNDKIEGNNPRIIIKKPFDQVLIDLKKVAKDKNCKRPSVLDIIGKPSGLASSMQQIHTDSKQPLLKGQPPIMDLSGMTGSLIANAKIEQVFHQRGIELKS